MSDYKEGPLAPQPTEKDKSDTSCPPQESLEEQAARSRLRRKYSLLSNLNRLVNQIEKDVQTIQDL